jgi:hypothetical protein
MIDRRWLCRSVLGVGGVLALGWGISRAQLTVCVGDCDGDGETTVDELLVMVNIAQGTASLSTCEAGDANGDGEITIEEITMGVNIALSDGCSALPTPTPTPTPPPGGALGAKRFTFDPRNSQFRAAISPGFIVSLGAFRGQTNGQMETAYLDFEAGEPDENGFAPLNVVGSSEYIYADAGAVAPLVLCLKPILPVTAAGVIDCNGTADFSIVTSIDHRIGQVGIDGFTAEDCSAAGGTLEGPNQICAAGTVGEACVDDVDCGAEGICGLATAMCTGGTVGTECRNDADCDSPGMTNGICGTPAVEGHAGVCNGPVMFGQGGDTNRPGEVVIAPLPEFGLAGLPVELSIESAAPCGDEGPGLTQAFAMTTARSRTTVFHFNNTDEDFPFEQRGLNFSCSNWGNSPGRFVLSFAVLHQFGGSDVITGFEFGSAVPAPQP